MKANDETIIFPELAERERVRVSFRQTKDGDITAVFLDQPVRDGMMDCFGADGHASCDIGWIRTTKAARSYGGLRMEMEAAGYDVIVMKKMVYPKPGRLKCEKCGATVKVDFPEYERICREEDRNAGSGWKRMTAQEWAMKNHECKIKKRKAK